MCGGLILWGMKEPPTKSSDASSYNWNGNDILVKKWTKSRNRLRRLGYFEDVRIEIRPVSDIPKKWI